MMIYDVYILQLFLFINQELLILYIYIYNCPYPRTCVGKAAVCMVPMAVAVPELLGFAVLPGGPWWRYHGLVLVSWD